MTTREPSLYVDASALAKTFRPEAESRSLVELIAGRKTISSALLGIELMRAARRVGGDAVARAETELQGVHLVPINEEICAGAATLDPPNLSSSDAIHVATARHVAAEIAGLVTYDRVMSDAARALGITVLAPS